MAVQVKEKPVEITPFSLKPEDETLPKLLLRNYRRYGDKRVAERRKDFGVWQEYTWKDVYEHVKWFSLGLVSMGLERGDRGEYRKARKRAATGAEARTCLKLTGRPVPAEAPA